MNTLKDIGIINLCNLGESILDDMESAMTVGDDYVDNELIDKWATDDKCKAFKTRTGYVLHGNFKLTDIGETYSGPCIKTVKGNIAISKTKLRTLEGIFNVDTEITGSLTIEDNDNLISLKGCPLIVKNSLKIVGNKNLKNIDVSPTVYGNAYVSKNGKKFSKETLATSMQVYKHIFCSVDDEFVIESEDIMEAFKAPELALIANSIKKASKLTTDRDSRYTFNNISQNVPWNQIDSSNIYEYDIDDPECVKMIRKLTSGKIRYGLMAMLDEEGDVYAIASNFCSKTISVMQLKSRWDAKGNEWDSQRTNLTMYSSTRELKPTELIGYVTNKTSSPYTVWGHPDFDSVIFVTWTLEDINVRRNKQQERNAAKFGALALKTGTERSTDRIDKTYVRYYQSIADENRKRYKQMITVIRSQRALLSNNFSTLKIRIDKAFDRYTALLAKMLQNPTKYNSYDLDWLNDCFNVTYTSPKNKHTTVERGLFVQLERYMRYIIDASKGELYKNDNIQNNIKELEDKIEDYIDRVEKKLTELENK